MGIEPTDHMISMRPYGFEDRDQHQLSKHFRFIFSAVPRLIDSNVTELARVSTADLLYPLCQPITP